MKEISPSEILSDLTPRQEVWYKLRANRSAMTALIVLLLLIAGAVLAPLIATHDPFEQFTDTLLAPPYPAAESRPGFSARDG